MLTTGCTRRSSAPPDVSLNLPTTYEISVLLGISQRRVEQLVSSAFQKLEAAGQLDNFYTLVRSTQIAKAQRESEAECAAADFHPVLQCTSIECNPGVWA